VETGELRWETALLPGLDLQWAAPAVTEHLVVVTDTVSHPGSATTSWIHALDRRTGAVAWRVDLNDAQQGFHESPLLAADGVLTVVSQTAIIGIDLATGQERWRRESRSLPQLIEVVDGVLHAREDGLAVQRRMADGAEAGG
jgi:outer membrane protein assembly factor BamB